MTPPPAGFPKSLPEFQRMFPDDAACALYLESVRWRKGFTCPYCDSRTPPYRFANRPGVLRCRDCRKDVALTAGTVMERTHTPLTTWFWAGYLVASLTPGMSARQLQRQLGLSRYETAFQILHKLRAGMVRPERDRIGEGEKVLAVEVDETWVGGRTRGKGRGVHQQTLVVGAIEVKERQGEIDCETKRRRGGRIAGRLRLAVADDRTAASLCGFVEATVSKSASMVITDAWTGYGSLESRGYQHLAVAERDDPQVAEDYMPLIHLIFSNLKAWLNGVHHGVGQQHLQAYLNEFTFRFNRRFWPMNSFRSLLGLSAAAEAPTYAALYSGEWAHPDGLTVG